VVPKRQSVARTHKAPVAKANVVAKTDEMEPPPRPALDAPPTAIALSKPQLPPQLRVRINGAAGPVRIHGCGVSELTDEASLTLSLPAEPCWLRAFRRDGAFRIVADPLAVDAKQGLPAEWNIDFPDERMAGLGIQISLADDGISMDRILEGSALSEHGIEAGDVILAINGQSTVEMTVNDFIDVGLGAAHSQVELLVDTLDGERTVKIERLYFDK
jgi:hypothetical protein